MTKPLSKVTSSLAVLVSLEFFFIFYLETLATTSARTSQVFNFSVETLELPTVSLLLQNQGVYNLMIGLLILFVLFKGKAKEQQLGMLLIYILVVAIYGGISSDISIFFKQGTLPLLATLSLAWDRFKN